MTFREFVQAICYASGEQFSSKAAITLLKEITKSDEFEEDLSSISNPTFSGYLREERNLSVSFARNIQAFYTRHYLEDYLEDICDVYQDDSQRFCEAFAPYCPGIDSENAVELAAAQFEKMLDEIIHGASRSKSPSMPAKDRKKIKALVKKIRLSMERCIESGTKVIVGASIRQEEENRILQQRYEEDRAEFLDLNAQLRDYAVLSTEWKIIETIHVQSSWVDFKLKYIRRSNGVYMENDDSLKQYQHYLDQLTKILLEKK